jgi:hypothetical protein
VQKTVFFWGILGEGGIPDPPRVVSGIMGGGGGLVTHGGDKCPGENHFSQTPPPPLSR